MGWNVQAALREERCRFLFCGLGHTFGPVFAFWLSYTNIKRQVSSGSPSSWQLLTGSNEQHAASLVGGSWIKWIFFPIYTQFSTYLTI